MLAILFEYFVDISLLNQKYKLGLKIKIDLLLKIKIDLLLKIFLLTTSLKPEALLHGMHPPYVAVTWK